MSAYRWDIQGLRAIAVMSVVIFHINPQLLSGGYIGVDIFFVISGYLIMGFIWRDLNNHSFSLMHFYSKRVQRLFPALLVMVVVSAIFAYFILLPHEALKFSSSLIATLLYVSNFYFYLEADYFNDAMEFAPLLHTWSLSVEEQFYLLFPLLLMLLFSKAKKDIFKLLLFLSFVSLILSQILISYDKSFAFFASPTRFFQFIIGGVVAISFQKNSFSKVFNSSFSVIGLVIIILSLFLYDAKTLFPGIHALVPTLATALVLFAGQNPNFISAFLSNRLFRVIGNSSYSIYLWHWSLIVFYKLQVSPSLSNREQVFLLLASLGLGYLSWRYIEKSTRAKNYTIEPSKLLFSVLSLTFIISLGSYYIFNTLSSKQKNIASSYLDYNTSKFRSGECFLTSDYDSIKFFDKDKCIIHTQGKKNYLLIGDSHAAHFYSALNQAKKNNITITQVTASGCHPTLPYNGTKRCSDLMQWAYEELIREKKFDTIILSAHWTHSDKEQLLNTINLLQKYTKRVVVFGPNMEYLQSLPRLIANLDPTQDTRSIYKNAGKYKEVASIDYSMKTYLKAQSIEYISILKLLCDENGCTTTTPEGIPIAFDASHLTHSGAYYIIESIQKRLFQEQEAS